MPTAHHSSEQSHSTSSHHHSHAINSSHILQAKANDTRSTASQETMPGIPKRRVCPTKTPLFSTRLPLPCMRLLPDSSQPGIQSSGVGLQEEISTPEGGKKRRHDPVAPSSSSTTPIADPAPPHLAHSPHTQHDRILMTTVSNKGKPICSATDHPPHRDHRKRGPITVSHQDSQPLHDVPTQRLPTIPATDTTLTMSSHTMPSSSSKTRDSSDSQTHASANTKTEHIPTHHPFIKTAVTSHPVFYNPEHNPLQPRKRPRLITTSNLKSTDGTKDPRTCKLRPTLSDLTLHQGHLKRPVPSVEFTSVYPSMAQLYNHVIATNQPNHKQAQQTVDNKFDINKWRHHLTDYHDTELLGHLQYGFPIGYATKIAPQTDNLNHASTLANHQAVDDYIQTELTHKALAGPFTSPPFSPWFHVSPMMLRDKKGTDQKRVIVDLSWPLGRSVNANIPFDHYEGVPATMTLPTAVDFATAILHAPKTAYMYSLDLSRAYRQLSVDPQDWPLLGLRRGSYYFDRALAFGGRWHAAAC